MSTIREVAEKADVSSTTVSHVINNTRFVSEETRQRVLSAMAELGYRPNYMARSLRRGETNTIGLILPALRNPLFSEIGYAIEDTAEQRGYSVIHAYTDGSSEKEKIYINLVRNKRVDGVLFLSLCGQEEIIKGLVCAGVPVVILNREFSGLEVDIVLTDDETGGYLATRHLFELGHHRIGVISGTPEMQASNKRLCGYMAALQEAGIEPDPALIQAGNFQPASGYDAFTALMELPEPPSAVFAMNDLMALGALHSAADHGLRIPEQVALVGYDDIEIASYLTPPLTTVQQPIAEIGCRAVELIIQRIHRQQASAERVMLPVKLIARQSTLGRTRKIILSKGGEQQPY